MSVPTSLSSPARSLARVLLLMHALSLLIACGPPGAGTTLPIDPPEHLIEALATPSRHALTLRLEPHAHRLLVRDEIHFKDHAHAVILIIDARAHLEGVEIDGQPVTWRPEPTAANDDFDAPVTRLSLSLPTPPSSAPRADAAPPPPPPPPIVTVRYSLTLPAERPWIDAARAERPWISEDWVFLPSTIAWYPRVQGARPALTTTIELPPGFEACAEGRRVDVDPTTLRFESEHPSGGLTLVAGPWIRDERRVGARTLRTLLRAEHAHHSGMILDWLDETLPRVERRVGRFPFDAFTVIGSPGETSLAFPGYTVFDAALFERPERIWATTLEHELLHSWWGHLVFLGPGGNWMEGLVTYLAEHERRARLSAAQARLFRRLLMRDFRAHASDTEDRSIARFRGRHSHVDELVGYAKAALVFHMLRRHVGDQVFFQALRELTRRYRFKDATWNDVLAVFESTSNERLAEFSVDWITQGGAPHLALTAGANDGVTGTTQADHVPHHLRLSVAQTRPPYALRVPVVATLSTGVAYRAQIDLEGLLHQDVSLVVPGKPLRVCLDPDLEVFRALNDDELEPTIGDLLGAPERPLFDAAPALSATADLAMAARLAADFDRATADAPRAPRATLVLLERAAAREHGVLIDGSLVPWPSPLTATPDGVLTIGGQQHSSSRSLLLSFPRPPHTPPLVVLLAASDDDALTILASIDRFSPWSLAVVDQRRIIQRGLLPVTPTSLCVDVP